MSSLAYFRPTTGKALPESESIANQKVQLFENSGTRKRSLWTVREVADYLQVSERTIRDWVYRRTIPFRKAGQAVRFCPEEIECWSTPKHEE